MELNIEKCKTISYSRKREGNKVMYDYNISGVSISRCNLINDLGIMLDNKLNMNAHIDYITSKARQTLGFIKRQSKSFNDPYITRSLYCALVRPTLEYCSIAWYPFTQQQINKIESVQKQFLLFALRGLGWSNGFQLPAYESRLLLLNMDSLEERRKVAGATFMYKLMKDVVSVPNLKNVIVFNASNYNTRRRPLLTRSTHSTSYGMNNPMNRFTMLVNEHSNVFMSSETVNVFKRQIRERIKN